MCERPPKTSLSIRFKAEMLCVLAFLALVRPVIADAGRPEVRRFTIKGTLGEQASQLEDNPMLADFARSRSEIRSWRTTAMAWWETTARAHNFRPISDKHILPHFSHMSGGKYMIDDYDTTRDKFVVTDGGDFHFGSSQPGGLHAPSAFPDGEEFTRILSMRDRGWRIRGVRKPTVVSLDTSRSSLNGEVNHRPPETAMAEMPGDEPLLDAWQMRGIFE